MKKFIFIALAASMAFASCVKTETTKNTESVVEVSLPDNVVYTRAIQDPVADQSETAIADVSVFLINSGSNSVVKQVDFEPAEITAQKKRIEDVPAGVDRVIVVANIPSTETAIKTVPTATGVRNYAFSIAEQNNSTGVASKTLMGEGVPATATDPNPDTHNYKAVDIALSSVTARIEIGAVKPGTGIVDVELVGVWINNYYTDGSRSGVQLNPSSSTYWITSPLASTSPSATAFTPSITNAYVPTQYFDSASALVELDANSKAYTYHVFGGNLPHVILLVTGKYDTDYVVDGKEYFMGWVTFNKYNDGTGWITTMENNYIYKMGVGTKGIEITPEIITPEPEQEDFDLGIECTITPWTAKDVTPGV